MWRISWSEALLDNGWCRHRLADVYEKRVHNDGVIVQRPEYEMIKSEYPALAKKIQQIPCGKCIQCRLSYSREWANRCMCELKTSTSAFFLTLTYNDSDLHFAPHVDPDTGEASTRPVLVPKHLTDFMKRLRAYCKECYDVEGIRFFACGEYGEATQRPHYHMIVYNLPVAMLDKSLLWTPPGTVPPLWICDKLTKIWQYGIVVYGDVTWQTCAYVARYVVKKRKGKDRKAQIEAQEILFPDQPWQDEFVRMSRMPGIGREYYEKHKQEMYETDELFIPIKEQVQAVRPAKYYDKLYDVECHNAMKMIKKRRSEEADRVLKATLSATDLTEEQYLLMKDRSKTEQAARLPRPDI